MEGMVTISKREYLNLRLRKEEMRRLEAGGVDNWEWYGESLCPEGKPDMEEYEEAEEERIKAL